MHYIYLFLLFLGCFNTGFAQNSCSIAQLPNNQTVNTTNDFWFLKPQSNKILVKNLNLNRFHKLYLYSDCNTKLDSIIGQDSSNFTLYSIPISSGAFLCRLANTNNLNQSFQVSSPQTCEHNIFVSEPVSPANNGYYCRTSPITLQFSCDNQVGIHEGIYYRVRWFITGPNNFSTQIGFTSQLTSNYPLVYNFPAAGTYVINFAYDLYNYVTNQWVIAIQANQNPFTINIAAPLPPFNVTASDLTPCPNELVTLNANLPQGVIPPNMNICWNPDQNSPANWPFNTACTQLFNNQPQVISNLIYDNIPHTTTVTFNNGCLVEKSITINPKTNFINLQAIKHCGYKIKYQANFTDCASLNFTYSWSFPGGNPSTSNLISPLITYPNGSNYSATLIMTNTINQYQYGPFTINNVIPQLNLANQPPPPIVQINGVLNNQNLLECNANNMLYTITNATSFPGYTFSASNVTNGTLHINSSPHFVIQWDNNPNTLSSFVLTSTSADGCISTQIVRFFACCGSMQIAEFINGGNISTWLASNGINNGIVNTGNNELFINGTVNIDQDVTFLGCQNILMGVNAKLDIQNGVKLTINNSTLKACGGELWNGIYANHPSEKIIVYNSQFYDAKNALYLESNADYDIDGGRFYDNWVGISFQGMTTQSTAVRSSIFRTTNTMKRAIGLPNLLPTLTYQGDFSPQNKGTGIYMRSCFAIQIGDGTSNNLRNEFNDLNYGIYGSRSDAFVYNNKFININNTVTLNYTNHTPTAIYLMSSFDTPRNILIGSGLANHSNEFTNCTWGVYAYESMRGGIAWNEFNNNTHGIIWQLSRGGKNVIERNEMNTQSRFGILLNNNPGSTFDVRFNKVTCVQNLQTYTTTHGIYAASGISNAILQNYYINNNDVNDASFGIKLIQLVSAEVNQNRVSNFPASSISVLNYEIAGIQATACRRPFISENLVLGNDAFNPKVKGIDIQECTRPILSCDSVVTCGWAYAIRGLNTNSFIQRCSAGNSLYGYVYYNGGVSGPVGSSAPNNFVEGNKWWNIAGGHTLTTNLQGGNPTLGFLSPWYLPGVNTNTSENPNPSMVNQGGGVGIPISIQQLNTFNYPSSPCATIDYPLYKMAQDKEWLSKVMHDSAFMNAFDYNTRYFVKEQAFESLVDDSAYWQDDFLFTTYLNQAMLENSGTFEVVTNTINQVGSISVAQKAELDTLLATILPVRVQESNLVSVMRMYLNTYAIGIDTLESTDMAFLQSIAQTCYFQGGKAVLVARSMLGSLPNALPTEYADNCIALYGMQKLGSTIADSSVKTNNNIRIYPSPIEKGTNLFIDNAEGYVLQLSNLIGINQLEQKITTNKTSIILPTNLAAGLYIVKLTSNFGDTKTQKIVIQ